MRVIVYGMGAVGGCVAALLAWSGVEVLGIARGAMLDAVQRNGLRIRTPDLDAVVPVRCVAHPSEVDWRPHDMIVMGMKTQHMAAALEDLRAAGVTEQPLFCFQNGVTNEDMALRLFPNVHGVTVMMPATYLEPGKVISHGAPKYGLFDIGRYPSGSDAADHALAGLLDGAGMAGFVRDDIMVSKYGKLVLNLGNVLEAALGQGGDAELAARMRTEAEAVFAVAGIEAQTRDKVDPAKRALMNPQEIDGERRAGGSSAQSLLRGAGSIETDWLNGEIVRLGRVHGVPTPVNAAMQALGARLVRTDMIPGTLTREDVMALL